ncbi:MULTISPECIES: cyclic-di-AMP receptor [Alteribacter]|uniref:Transcriptional regulator n=1 Tax=Alteribacter keqinensis TaxID=2483800 RepID=A0A3M7TS90_9BACI|nr:MULTISPECIES: cyclic-di-AMP receptor [Alteribacter]MBM7097769.1 cyclic-di-AMP receptor [Alteribacter salitolerans]RNA67170.1 transcriptional regulator [Alteribacter keqinensis]
MKLVVCIVHNRYSDAMEKGLKDKGYRMTELASSGGFLKKGNTTFLLGVKDNDVDALQREMQTICLNLEKKKGKAKDVDSRYTSFVVEAKESLPILAAFQNKSN